MTLLILGLILFLGIHSVQIINPRIRARTIEKGGSLGAWMWPYTAIATVGLFTIDLHARLFDAWPIAAMAK